MAAILTSSLHAARKLPQACFGCFSCCRWHRLMSAKPASTTPTSGGDTTGDKGFGVRLWGDGSSGQLGFPADQASMLRNNCQTLPRALVGFETSGVRDVSCCSNHTALVTWDGELLTFGSNTYGKLGLGNDARSWYQKMKGGLHQTTPALVTMLNGVNVATVACGENHTVAVDANGVAYSWGWGGSRWNGGSALGLGSIADVSVPTEITTFSAQRAKVAKVSAGQNHTIFLTTDGEVWICGSGEYGRCGNMSASNHLEPIPVDFLAEHAVVDVKAGFAFSLALTSEGEIYGWGRDDGGQLGLGGGFIMDVYAMQDAPCRVSGLEGEKVVSIAAGHTHAAAITERGRLYMWGMKRSLEPECLDFGDSSKLVNVSCGLKYTAAVTDEGAVYTVGKGGYALGHGNRSTQPRPTLVKSLSGERVARVECGFNHVAALVES